MTHRRALYAAHGSSLCAAAITVESVDTSGRTLSGTILPYGEVGQTSLGPVLVPGPGRIQFPADLQRVKLVTEHPAMGPVGYLLRYRDTPEGLRAEFHVANTPAGDLALLEAAERVRDGFSVELTNLELTSDGELVSALLTAVAQIPVPAFDNAREDGLAASQHHHTTTEGSITMTRAQRARLTALLAKANRTDAEAAELSALQALANVFPDPATDTEADPEDDPADHPDEDDEDDAEDQPLPTTTLAATRRRAARVPATPGRRPSRGRPIQELYAATARVLSGNSRPELEAALSDITNTANIWTARDDYAGQLWSGVEYQRRFVPLMLSGPLNSYKGTGWKWLVKPEVADYAGDKAAVPSNAASTEATAWTAARLAGAHDIDRKFVDFGDTEFIAAYYQAMTESYAIKSDDKARAFILASAVASGAAGTTIWHAAAQAASEVFDATGGRTVNYLLVNSGDILDLVNVNQDSMPDPKVLEAFGVSMDKFIVTPGVAAGTVVAGVKEATRFRELSSSPIRVEAINIANGGIDGGVFGYYATEETFEGGIQSATFAAV